MPGNALLALSHTACVLKRPERAHEALLQTLGGETYQYLSAQAYSQSGNRLGLDAADFDWDIHPIMHLPAMCAQQGVRRAGRAAHAPTRARKKYLVPGARPSAVMQRRPPCERCARQALSVAARTSSSHSYPRLICARCRPSGSRSVL